MEAEIDLWRAGKNAPDLDLQVWSVLPLAAGEVFTGGPPDATLEGRRALLGTLAALEADLYVFRYPTWILGALEDEFRRLFADRPTLAWMSEQGPTLPAAIACARAFPRVGVNNRYELPAYAAALPGVPLHYLPFGCAAWADDERVPDDQWRSQLIADGGCHYQCGEHGGWKRTSVDVVVRPVLDMRYSLGVWGHGPVDHGWLGVPGISRSPAVPPVYRGAFPAAETSRVYASCALYLGITWNWGLGGMGTKLARALAAGIPVVWHRTVGLEAEGVLPGTHLFVTGSAEETRRLVPWLMEEDDWRRRVGEQGRRWALANWEWGMNLRRIVDEIHRAG